MSEQALDYASVILDETGLYISPNYVCSKFSGKDIYIYYENMDDEIARNNNDIRNKVLEISSEGTEIYRVKKVFKDISEGIKNLDDYDLYRDYISENNEEETLTLYWTDDNNNIEKIFVLIKLNDNNNLKKEIYKNIINDRITGWIVNNIKLLANKEDIAFKYLSFKTFLIYIEILLNLLTPHKNRNLKCEASINENDYIFKALNKMFSIYEYRDSSNKIKYYFVDKNNGNNIIKGKIFSGFRKNFRNNLAHTLIIGEGTSINYENKVDLIDRKKKYAEVEIVRDKCFLTINLHNFLEKIKDFVRNEPGLERYIDNILNSYNPTLNFNNLISALEELKKENAKDYEFIIMNELITLMEMIGKYINNRTMNTKRNNNRTMDMERRTVVKVKDNLNSISIRDLKRKLFSDNEQDKITSKYNDLLKELFVIEGNFNFYNLRSILIHGKKLKGYIKFSSLEDNKLLIVNEIREGRSWSTDINTNISELANYSQNIWETLKDEILEESNIEIKFEKKGKQAICFSKLASNT